jgi:dihydrodipicolinate synthase/N-acetylneuraminate lyase
VPAPPYGSESAEGAYQYFREVVNSVRIGVLLYPRGKESYWPDVLRRLAELRNVIGFKDPSVGTDIGKALGSLVPDQLLWVAEGETHAAQALPAGARAYTTAVATFVPEACRKFWKQAVAGNVNGMNEVLKNRIEPAVQIRSLKPGYGISGIKVALEALPRKSWRAGTATRDASLSRGSAKVGRAGAQTCRGAKAGQLQRLRPHLW